MYFYKLFELSYTKNEKKVPLYFVNREKFPSALSLQTMRFIVQSLLQFTVRRTKHIA